MDIFDMLDYGNIIFRDRDENIIVTWDTCTTFNVWSDRGDGTFANMDVFYSSHFLTLDEAVSFAKGRTS